MCGSGICFECRRLIFQFGLNLIIIFEPSYLTWHLLFWDSSSILKKNFLRTDGGRKGGRDGRTDLLIEAPTQSLKIGFMIWGVLIGAFKNTKKLDFDLAVLLSSFHYICISGIQTFSFLCAWTPSFFTKNVIFIFLDFLITKECKNRFFSVTFSCDQISSFDTINAIFLYHFLFDT